MRVMIFLAIVGIHVDGPLAVLNGEMVGIHLAVGRRSVAVEHRVASVQLNGLQAIKTTTFKIVSKKNKQKWTKTLLLEI
jgi:hypothetical protein